jgi:anti-anti-sigma factor
MNVEPADEPVRRRSRFDVHVDKHLMAHVNGELDVSTAPRFAVELDRLAADGGTVCVDLANLDFCGAAGINVLVGAVRTLGTRGRLVVYDPSPMVARVIDITGLDLLVDVVVGRVITPTHPAGADGPERGPSRRSVAADRVGSVANATPALAPEIAFASVEAEGR